MTAEAFIHIFLPLMAAGLITVLIMIGVAILAWRHGSSSP
jgi:hypothetical protein